MRKTIVTLLALLFITPLIFVAGNVYAGTSLEHRFFIELPDGSKEPLKGAMIHRYYQGRTDLGEKDYVVRSQCHYPEFNDEFPVPNGGVGDGYHCAVGTSCFFADYGAPYIPHSFNSNEEIFTLNDASYKAFYGKTFTEFLNSKVPYLAAEYQPDNIRGFEGAKWEAKVDYDLNDSKTGLTIPSDLSDARFNSAPEWGKVDKISGTQSWEPGEVFKNENGGNVLQGRISWTLKVPSVSLEKPTASITGECGPQEWNGPLSYEIRTTNFDLKGGNFNKYFVFIGFTYSDQTRPILEFLGKSSYEPDNWQPKEGDWFGYELASYNSLPQSGTIEFVWDDSIKLGSNQKTINDLVNFIAQRGGAVSEIINVQSNLSAVRDGSTGTNQHVGTYRAKLTKNACATPPDEPPPPTEGPQCRSIELINNQNQVITDYKTIKPGDTLRARCGEVAGVDGYQFRILILDQNNQQQDIVNIPQSSSRMSPGFPVPETGKFAVQCTICTDGTCQPYEDPGLGRTRDNPPAPSDNNEPLIDTGRTRDE